MIMYKTKKNILLAAGSYSLCRYSEDYQPSVAEVTLVARGSASFRFFLGPDERQAKLFSMCIQWDRLLIVEHGNIPIGYAAYFAAGRGVYHPTLRQFFSEYGYLTAGLRYVVFQFFQYKFSRPQSYLFKLFMLPKYRNKGLGCGLMTGLFEELLIKSINQVDLEVYAKNQQAIKFYKRLGFQVEHIYSLPLLGRFLPGASIYKMNKKLAKSLESSK